MASAQCVWRAKVRAALRAVPPWPWNTNTSGAGDPAAAGKCTSASRFTPSTIHSRDKGSAAWTAPAARVNQEAARNKPPRATRTQKTGDTSRTSPRRRKPASRTHGPPRVASPGPRPLKPRAGGARGAIRGKDVEAARARGDAHGKPSPPAPRAHGPGGDERGRGGRHHSRDGNEDSWAYPIG